MDAEVNNSNFSNERKNNKYSEETDNTTGNTNLNCYDRTTGRKI